MRKIKKAVKDCDVESKKSRVEKEERAKFIREENRVWDRRSQYGK